MQGVPIYPDSLEACGVESLFDTKIVSPAAFRRMAGNSFSQPCMSGFISFVLSQMQKSPAKVAPGEMIYHTFLDHPGSNSEEECEAVDYVCANCLFAGSAQFWSYRHDLTVHT